MLALTNMTPQEITATRNDGGGLGSKRWRKKRDRRQNMWVGLRVKTELGFVLQSKEDDRKEAKDKAKQNLKRSGIEPNQDQN